MSYTPLKTINGQSIKGTGDLTVTGTGVSDGDKGDITVSGSGTVWTIDNNAVTNAKINDVSVTKVTGTKAEFNTACTDGNFLYVGDVVGLTDGDKGDITVSSSGTVWNIDAATVGVTELSATGTANNTTFLRGDNTWAVPNNNPEGWTTIVKSANQDVTNNATLQTDTDLQFSVVAGGHYMVEMDVVFSSTNTSADYKSAFNVSAGTMKGAGISIGAATTGAAQTSAYNANPSASTNSISSGTISADIDVLSSIKIIYSFTASANATFRYQFAQNTAVASTTARVWKGSILKYKRID